MQFGENTTIMFGNTPFTEESLRRFVDSGKGRDFPLSNSQGDSDENIISKLLLTLPFCINLENSDATIIQAFLERRPRLLDNEGENYVLQLIPENNDIKSMSGKVNMGSIIDDFETNEFGLFSNLRSGRIRLEIFYSLYAKQYHNSKN